MKKMIAFFLVLITLIIGIILVFVGIKETYKSNQETKNYITTDGYFSHYDIYDCSDNTFDELEYGIISEEECSYSLTYAYTVAGKKYFVTTDYGSNYIPNKNSIKKVKYNPKNPNEAIITGFNGKMYMIYMGIFFILVTMGMIVFVLYLLGYFDKFKIDIMKLTIGFIFLITGIGAILLQNAETMSLVETFKSLGFFSIIPIVFIIFGIIAIISSVTIKKKKRKSKKPTNVKTQHLK